MFVFPGKIAFGLALAALCLGGRAAHAQTAPVQYLNQGALGFGDGLTVDPGSNGNRYNFPNGWFVGSERSRVGLGLSGINQSAAFGNSGSVYAEGMQFGYNFKNAPLSVYAGFDTLKSNNGLGGPFATFDSQPSTLPGYSAHAGVAFKPTSNVSLSLGVGFAQQPSDGDINSQLARSANPFAIGGRPQ